MTSKRLIIAVLLLGATWARASLATYTTGVIPVGNPVGAVFTGSLSGYTAANGNPNPTVSDLTVDLTISGGYNGALYAYLVAPNGTLEVLMNQPGVAVNGFGAYGSGMNITLSDAGGTSIQSVTSGGSLSGTYAAAGSLSGFNSSAVNGTWTLFFADLASGGGNATLTGWSLNLTAVPEPVGLALGLFAAMLLALAGLKWLCQPSKK